MNDLERLQRLAAQARREEIPRLDVTAGVRARLRQAVERPAVSLPLCVFSGLSVVIASIVLLMAIETWSTLVDPMSGLFSPLTMVMQ